MTRKKRLGVAMALIRKFVCGRSVDGGGNLDCNECSEFLTDTYGVEDRCPYDDLQALLGTPWAKEPRKVDTAATEGG